MGFLDKLSQLFIEKNPEAKKPRVKTEFRAEEYIEKLKKLFENGTFQSIVDVNLSFDKVETPNCKTSADQIFECTLFSNTGLMRDIGAKDVINVFYLEGKRIEEVYKIIKEMYLYFTLNMIENHQCDWDIDEISFDSTICSLCYSGKVEFFLSCSHSLCSECFKSWFKVKSKTECPTCRHPFKSLAAPAPKKNEPKPQVKKIINMDSDFDCFKIINEPQDKEYERIYKNLVEFLTYQLKRGLQKPSVLKTAKPPFYD